MATTKKTHFRIKEIESFLYYARDKVLHGAVVQQLCSFGLVSIRVDSSCRLQILSEAVSISFRVNSLWKGLNPIILTLCKDR